MNREQEVVAVVTAVKEAEALKVPGTVMQRQRWIQGRAAAIRKEWENAPRRQ